VPVHGVLLQHSEPLNIGLGQGQLLCRLFAAHVLFRCVCVMMIALRGTAPVPDRQQLRRHSARCPASSVDIVRYNWEQLPVPQLKDGGRLFSEEVRVKGHEVGPNQQSNVVTVSNMLQVRPKMIFCCFLYLRWVWLVVYGML
jgi:hypothetical protein